MGPQSISIKIDKQISNKEEVLNRVKAAGSERLVFLPKKLYHILLRFKERQLQYIENPKWILQIGRAHV